MHRLIPLLIVIALIFTGLASSADSSKLEPELHSIMKEWAHIKYQLPKKQQESQFEDLAEKATALVSRYPESAEPKIWEAIIRASLAGSMGGIRSLFTALPQAKQARDLLLEAETIDPNALDGSVYTSLGSLYYQVPGSPVGFGDTDKALAYLERARKISPDGIDANYFMGDYWLNQGDHTKARYYLERALQAPLRPDRPIADEGRRDEIRIALSKIRS